MGHEAILGLAPLPHPIGSCPGLASGLSSMATGAKRGMVRAQNERGTSMSGGEGSTPHAARAGDRRPIAARELAVTAALAGWLIRRRASPDAISAAGMVCGVLAGLAFAGTWYWPEAARPLWLAGALLVQLRLLANMLDGMVAVGRGIASPLGELWNEVPDRVSDSAILLGVGIAAQGNWALGLAAALAAISTAYIRAVGKAAGAPSDFRGPMAKQQRMFAVTLLGLWAGLAPAAWQAGFSAAWWVLVIVTALSFLTAIRRLQGATRALRARK
jgi:phosphatidylglycerophosphate synthase